MLYKRTQVGSLVPLLSGALFAIVLIGLTAGGEATSLWWAIPMMLAIFAVVVVFSRLTVTVTSAEVSAAFGFGFPRKTIRFDEVIGVGKVTNSWWYGYGIRKVPNGWMYNVWGFDALEFKLASGKSFRIGSDDCDNFLASVNLTKTW